MVTSSDKTLILAGGKTGVVLLNDLGAPAGELMGLARHFNEEGFTVALADVGADAATSESLSASTLITDAGSVLSRLRQRCGDIMIVGVSYGGVLGLEIARQSKTAVQAVVLVEPRAWLQHSAVPAPVSRILRQTWVAKLGRAMDRLDRRAGEPAVADCGRLGLASSAASSASVHDIAAAQLLDCLHVTLGEVRQPVLIARRQDAPKIVLDSATLLQRRLGGRVETAIIDDPAVAAVAHTAQIDLAERSARFLASVVDEVATRRDNEQRRRRVAAGRSNAA